MHEWLQTLKDTHDSLWAFTMLIVLVLPAVALQCARIAARRHQNNPPRRTDGD